MRDLAPAGDLTSPQTYPFEFDNVEMQYDSYRGLQVRLRCVPLYQAPCPSAHYAFLVLPAGDTDWLTKSARSIAYVPVRCVRMRSARAGIALQPYAQLALRSTRVGPLQQNIKWCSVGARYLLRVTVTRGYGASVVKDFPFWVRNYGTPPETSNLPPIKVRSAVPARGSFLRLFIGLVTLAAP